MRENGKHGKYIFQIGSCETFEIPQGYFIPGYQERIEQKIDKMIQTIEQKYGSR